ncbi:putative methyltransferase-domain-containing protein [Ephemerocybe angulata]|uniref:Putative methyltransferase-domain-containing protein n=1 Tax=Ephemerocybe angulata TaxID=980116 RepID=A0A8H6M2F2_9AGAR|nr:putative methyltransferase-domain-containing protein [Tulosesus angulatus]
MSNDDLLASHGLILLPEDSSVIEDAEEEIFYLYTILQSAPQDRMNLRGLGFLDAKQDVVDLRFDLVPPTAEPSSPAAGKRTRKSRQRIKPAPPVDSYEFQLIQDKTALNSRKGDTGSVVWKASIDLSRFVLQEHAFPTSRSLFSSTKLKTSHVVELGAGTGLLSLIFSPLVRKYTVTDTADLISLIQKNVRQNFPGWPSLPEGAPGSNIAVESLDWIELQRANESQQAKLLSDIVPSNEDPINLVLVVDCIYHPTLIPPLLATIDRLATSSITEVLVLSELRSEEVLREFLEGWMCIPGWKVWHVGGDLLQDLHYVMWIGRKNISA